MKKMIALLVLVIPGILAAYGIKMMRDSMFGILIDPFTLLAFQFIVGLLLTVFGVWFIGGYLLHREKKNKQAQLRFMALEEESKKNHK